MIMLFKCPACGFSYKGYGKVCPSCAKTASTTGDPTPEEIRQVAALIRKEWSEEERAKRVVGAKRYKMEVPRCSLASMSGDY